MGGLEQRIPPQPAKVPVRMLGGRVMHGEGATRHPAAEQSENCDRCELASSNWSHEMASVWNGNRSTPSRARCGYSKPCCQAHQPKCTKLLVSWVPWTIGTNDRLLPVTDFRKTEARVVLLASKGRMMSFFLRLSMEAASYDLARVG